MLPLTTFESSLQTGGSDDSIQSINSTELSAEATMAAAGSNVQEEQE